MSTAPGLTIRDWPVADFSAMPLDAGQTALWWLGQAGFAVRFGAIRLLIDPYLSDFLAAKYAGKEAPHARMMPAPLDARAVGDLDLVFCSHAHSDHMDPDTLGPIARNNPGCRFVVPRAVVATAAKRGVDPAATIGLDDGESAELADGVGVEAVAAAHETLRTNDRGSTITSATCFASASCGFTTAATVRRTRASRPAWPAKASTRPCCP